MIKGNKGEWSELYAFLKLLDEKTLYAADEDLKTLPDIFFPILKIIREEVAGKLNYAILDKVVSVLEAEKEIAIVNNKDLKIAVQLILQTIRETNEKTFEIPSISALLKDLHVTRLGAGSSHKEALVIKIHDRVTGAEPELGFSIKSRLGASSTLLNPSGATNFVFKIKEIDDSVVSKLKEIEGVKSLLQAITTFGGKLEYQNISSEIFEKNLRKVDTVMPEILGHILVAYYLGFGSSISDILNNLDYRKNTILNYGLNKQDYQFKIKGLLHNIALGLVPNTQWDGLHKAQGGYIIVREDGEIVCYHVYNIDAFRNYLFLNTKLDTPSTTRYKFGTIYKNNDEYYINLNLQIRFIK